MAIDFLEPRLDLLGEEYVLVQAWKKTASYIRYHNWYADTLELDYVALNLPKFLGDLSRRLKRPEAWISDPLRIVPAPKSQPWHVTRDARGRRRWTPVDTGASAAKIRPLAHVSIQDQVAATALMLCLANRVETIQGDPRSSIADAESRKRTISYGNRLFCDRTGNELQHRWGSAKLYRGYFQDYRRFIERPEYVANSIQADGAKRVVILHSDLRQFYDRVHPDLLAQKLQSIALSDDDQRFFVLANKILRWRWNRKDLEDVGDYARQAGIEDFSAVALPQGLVSAGFFSNISLLDFDRSLQDAISQEISPGVRIEDGCRYVDDLRIVLTVDATTELPQVEAIVASWLQQHLDRNAPGLHVSKEKTKAAMLGGEERPLVRQSRKMKRIQNAISGGFDAIAGEEILNAVQGLIRSQQRYAAERIKDEDWPYLPVPDVRDETVSRFAAARFRTTYRSLRPLLDTERRSTTIEPGDEGDDEGIGTHAARTQEELDNDARAFALGLIENWLEDPSNVRLLRIGLDLWPAKGVVSGLLDLVRPYTRRKEKGKGARHVALYCLSEIFRAGATETGFVAERESLPAEVDVQAYRDVLRKEAVRVVSNRAADLPWYLVQQALLLLAANSSLNFSVKRVELSSETKRYIKIIRFLQGEFARLGNKDFATLSVLARRAFRERGTGLRLILSAMTSRRLEQIAERDPEFAKEILTAIPELQHDLARNVRDDLTLVAPESEGWTSLATEVLKGNADSRLRNELALLRFASKFLEHWPHISRKESIAPVDVYLKLGRGDELISAIKIASAKRSRLRSMYGTPVWAMPEERWRFQLGYLMRFILTGRADFTRNVRSPSWKEGTETYRAPESHWYQRLYGLFNGHSAFGDDWVPISDWTERLLSALLEWPGCRPSDEFEWVRAGVSSARRNIEMRIQKLTGIKGASGGLLMLPISSSWPSKPVPERPLRVCVVQTVLPGSADIKIDDLACANPQLRKRHRNHLSAALAAIERMLALRETHKGRDGRLDWLIFPELAIHPSDVKTHLVPFARSHKTIILAGMTYQELFVGKPLVNSALWIIPVWSPTHGLQMVVRRQGKQHLAPLEQTIHRQAVKQGLSGLQGFRPCQWLVGYEWSSQQADRALQLTAAICYDATDLALVADLRNQSDVFAIPALNQDVTTFDQMALALHYHMYQMVIVANNGLFGGSNAYAPHKEVYERQVFHMHGQPQASIAFLEIDDIRSFLQRKTIFKLPPVPLSKPGLHPLEWKVPPAGIFNPDWAVDP